MRRHSILALAGATAALCLSLSACAGSSSSTGSAPASGAGAGSTTTSPSTAASAPGEGSSGGSGSTSGGSSGGSTGSAGSTPTATVAAGPAPCTGKQITVGHTGGDGAAGHIAVVISFTNWTDKPCTLHGYPGVAGLDGADNQVVQARRTLRGMMGGAAAGATHPPTVLVPAHGLVSARVEASDVPQGGATSCTTYQGLLVTPPGTTTSTRLVAGVQLPGCAGLEVHPVVPGTTGSQD